MSKTALGAPPDRDSAGRFSGGNTLAVTTGARSNALVKRKAEEITSELTAHLAKYCQHLTPADQPMVELAVETLAQMRLIRDYWGETSGGAIIDRRGKPRASAQLYIDLMRQAMSLFRELGIGPRARAQILGDLGLAAERKAQVVRQVQDQLRAESLEPKELTDGNNS